MALLVSLLVKVATKTFGQVAFLVSFLVKNIIQHATKTFEENLLYMETTSKQP